MKMRTVVGILLLTLTVGWGTPAAFADYPPTVGAGRVSKSELKQCQCTQFSGEGFAPGAPVTIVDRWPDGTVHRVATVTADDKGGFHYKVCFDGTSPEGSHTLTASGTEPGGGAHEDSADVVVSGSACNGKNDEVHPNGQGAGIDDPAAGPGAGGAGSGAGSGSGSGAGSGANVGGLHLPRTGAVVVVPALAFGFLLVLLGALAAQLTRRRRVAAG